MGPQILHWQNEVHGWLKDEETREVGKEREERK